jgi:CheY-like chemotaxis protein
MPEDKRRLLQRLHDPDAPLVGKKVLIVDDDIRNIYAMTSVVERHGMSVVAAENGRDAIAAMHGNPGIDVVLMDIMLPEMGDLDDPLHAAVAASNLPSSPSPPRR